MRSVQSWISAETLIISSIARIDKQYEDVRIASRIKEIYNSNSFFAQWPCTIR